MSLKLEKNVVKVTGNIVKKNIYIYLEKVKSILYLK